MKHAVHLIKIGSGFLLITILCKPVLNDIAYVVWLSCLWDSANNRLWYVLCCVWDVAYKRFLAANEKRLTSEVVVAGFLSSYPLQYV